MILTNMKIVSQILEELEFALFCIILAAKALGAAFLNIIDPMPPLLLNIDGHQCRQNLARRPAIRTHEKPALKRESR
jgi:hypothetical protein